MMGTKMVEIVSLIGKKAVLYSRDGFGSKVDIIDAKIGWGKAYYLVKDEFGSAAQWVSEDRIEALSAVKSAISIIKEVFLP